MDVEKIVHLIEDGIELEVDEVAFVKAAIKAAVARVWLNSHIHPSSTNAIGWIEHDKEEAIALQAEAEFAALCKEKT